MTLTVGLLPNPQSPLARLDPRWKLAGILLLTVAVALLHTLASAAVAFGLSVVLALVARLPWQWYLSRLGMVALFLVVVVILLPFLV